MILSHMWLSYDMEVSFLKIHPHYLFIVFSQITSLISYLHITRKLNDYTRMRLALDLVLKGYNPNRDTVIKFAVDNMTKKAGQQSH